MTWLPFHDSYLGIGKPVESVNYLVNKVISCFNASLEWSQSFYGRRKFAGNGIPDIRWARVLNNVVLFEHIQQVFKVLL